jgi:hypothetical protein
MEASMKPGISFQQLDNFNILLFWKRNEALLKEIDHSQTPAKSRLMFKEVSTNQG